MAEKIAEWLGRESGRVPDIEEIWSLTSQDGRSVDGYVLAKSGDKILFRRHSDSREFVISTATLVAENREKLGRLENFEVHRVENFGAAGGQPTAPRKYFPHAKPFVTSYEEAIVAARSSGKPVLLIFTGGHTPGLSNKLGAVSALSHRTPLASFMKKIFHDRQFRTFVGETFEVAHIHGVDGEPVTTGDPGSYSRTVREFNVSEVPCFVILSSEGELIGKAVGFGSRGPEECIRNLRAMLESN